MNLLVISRLLDIIISPTVPTTITDTITQSGSSLPSIKALLFALLAAIPAFFSWLAVTFFKKN